MSKILSCEFEVFGIVQEKQARSLGVHGWCMNTRNDSVKGEIEAPPEEFSQMKHWLKRIGSPTSRIDSVVFGNVKELDDYTFKNFTIRD